MRIYMAFCEATSFAGVISKVLLPFEMDGTCPSLRGELMSRSGL